MANAHWGWIEKNKERMKDYVYFILIAGVH